MQSCAKWHYIIGARYGVSLRCGCVIAVHIVDIFIGEISRQQCIVAFHFYSVPAHVWNFEILAESCIIKSLHGESVEYTKAVCIAFVGMVAKQLHAYDAS